MSDFYAAANGPKRKPRTPPLSAKAQARLEAMAPSPPKPGDRITIRWPGGLQDFEMDFEELDGSKPPATPGWFWLFGCVGTEYDERWGMTRHDYRTLYARYVSPGVYEMVPRGGGTSRENGGADPDVAARSGHNR